MGGLFRRMPEALIFEQIEKQDLAGLRRLLERNRAAARAHHPHNGAAALHLAALQGWGAGVRELVGAGANANECDGIYDATPLHMAVRKGHLDVMRALVRGRADLSRRHKHGHTPLMSAVERKNPAAVKLLLEAGPNPIEADGRLEILAWAVLTWGTVPDPCERALTVTVAGHLVDSFGRVDEPAAEGWTALMFAAAHAQADLVKLLLERGADASLLTSKGETARSLAATVLQGLEQKGQGTGLLALHFQEVLALLN